MDDVGNPPGTDETAEHRLHQGLFVEPPTILSAKAQAWLLENRDAIEAWNRGEEENEFITGEFSARD